MAQSSQGTVPAVNRETGGSHQRHGAKVGQKEMSRTALEIDLPDVKTSHNKVRTNIAENLLSFLGSKNPFPVQITAKDVVWLLDNTAYLNETTKQYEAEFVAAVFDKNTGIAVSSVVADLAGKLGIASGSAEEDTIKERLLPIMQDILPARVVKVNFNFEKQTAPLLLGPGGRNGISSDIKVVPTSTHGAGSVSTSEALVPEGTSGILSMKTVFAAPEGWGLISDIDDTIKITMTSDPIGILRSTFVDTPKPVAGMPELYRYISKLLTKEAPFFYLSASPYNLYPFLSAFRNVHYPQGTMILRDASWMNLAGLLENLTVGVQEYKVDRMNKIHKWLPGRSMICIGDSTQKDPESYAEIYRKYKGWIRLILIRKVTDIAAIGLEEKNAPERFEKAFEGIPRHAWFVFEKPEECYEVVKCVKEGGL